MADEHPRQGPGLVNPPGSRVAHRLEIQASFLFEPLRHAVPLFQSATHPSYLRTVTGRCYPRVAGARFTAGYPPDSARPLGTRPPRGRRAAAESPPEGRGLPKKVILIPAGAERAAENPLSAQRPAQSPPESRRIAERAARFPADYSSPAAPPRLARGPRDPCAPARLFG